MVASKRTPRVLSEKHDFNKGYRRQNLKINNKVQRKLILGNDFWFGKQNDILE